MKNKPGASKPEGGVRFPKGKKANQTSRPSGDGVDGKPGNLNGKEPSANEETKRADSQPKNWRRKTGSRHSDEAAKREQC